jgi:hypothetical protein
MATHIHNTIHIERPADEVYEFVATPANGVGTHPETRAVKGDTECPVGLGGTWVEVIQLPDVTPIEVSWSVTQAAPGRLWVIATDRLGCSGTSCEVTYGFTQSDDSTRLTRHMVITYRDRTALPAKAEALQRDSLPHATYVRTVKAVLEGDLTHR